MSDRRDDMLDYLDGEMDDARQADLHAWLNESPEHWDQLAALSFVHSEIGEQLRKEESAALFRIDALHGLPELERNKHEVTKHDVAAALSYVVRHTFTPKRVATLGSVAAALILAITLFFVLQDNSDSTGPAFVNTPPKPAESAPPIQPDPSGSSVATLTAVHNAQWGNTPAERALTSGSQLEAGTRLTLTAGFAEITTHRGAIAILEAPCVVELNNNDNALRLMSGKLVGICETESSKGFVVRTPHALITDLGTQFGVNAIPETSTEVHVIEGQVIAATTTDEQGRSQSIVLNESQAVRIDAVQPDLVTIKYDEQAYVRRLTKKLDLIDLVAGGDGLSGIREVGLNPRNGEYLHEIEGRTELGSHFSDNRTHSVAKSPYVHATFVPNGTTAPVGLPKGLRLQGIAPSGGQGFGVIWCGGSMPSVNPSITKPIPVTVDGMRLSDSGEAVTLHANVGLVIDLEAIAKHHPGFRAARLTARAASTAGTIERGDLKDYKSVFQVFTNDQIAFQANFSRSLPIEQHVRNIDLSIDEDDRYLTLIATDGGDSVFRDWIIIADPVLELTTN